MVVVAVLVSTGTWFGGEYQGALSMYASAGASTTIYSSTASARHVAAAVVLSARCRVARSARRPFLPQWGSSLSAKACSVKHGKESSEAFLCTSTSPRFAQTQSSTVEHSQAQSSTVEHTVVWVSSQPWRRHAASSVIQRRHGAAAKIPIHKHRR